MRIDWVKFRNEVVDFTAAEHNFKVERIQEYHLRLTNNHGKSLDFFPKSRRATWVGSGKWFKIDDIETFIPNTFLNYGEIHNQRSGTHH